MKQGEIYDHSIGEARFRVLILSSDVHNASRVPWIAPVRHGGQDIPPYFVALVDADPLGGSVDLDRMRRDAPNGALVGTITGATMARVRTAIHTLFEG